LTTPQSRPDLTGGDFDGLQQLPQSADSSPFFLPPNSGADHILEDSEWGITKVLIGQFGAHCFRKTD